METCALFVYTRNFERLYETMYVTSRPYGYAYGYDLRKIMSPLTSHNFEIPGFAFHPSRLTLPSHVSNIFLSKRNPYNLNLLLLLEHPQAEQQESIYYTAGRR